MGRTHRFAGYRGAVTPSHPSPAGPTPETPARVLGDYRLLSKIGEGGMGVVHLAQAPDGRRVALKELRPHVVGDEETRQRLAREVASLRHVRSRHVAEILDADPWGEVPYLITRYVPGHSLHTHVTHQGPVPLPDLVHVGHELLLALDDVHRVGVLHRDVKPSNVLMEGRAPVLIDFGLARMAEDPRLTMTGWMLGTPGFLPPEVLTGDDPTTACDVFSWAATMAFCATGQHPFGSGHTLAVLDRCRRGEVDLSAVAPALRPLLADCLAVAPHDRPTTAEARAELASLRVSLASSRDATVVLPTAAAAPSAEPPLTVPWQVAAASQPAAADVAGAVSEAAAAEATTTRLPAPPPAPPTKAYTVVAPAPAPVVMPAPQAYRAPAPAPYPGQPRPAQPHPGRQPHPAQRYPVPPYPQQAQPRHQRPPSYPSPVPQRQHPAAYAPPMRTAPPPFQHHARPGPQVRPTTAEQRRRAGIVLAALAVVVAVAFTRAPWQTIVGVGVAAWAVRGVSRTLEHGWMRRYRRGRARWDDAPRGLLTYPWHLVCTLPGALGLALVAGLGALGAVGIAELSGSGALAASVSGGAALALLAWFGPGAARVRTPLRQGSQRIGRSTVATVVASAVAAFVAAFVLVGYPLEPMGGGGPSQGLLGPDLGDPLAPVSGLLP